MKVYLILPSGKAALVLNFAGRPAHLGLIQTRADVARFLASPEREDAVIVIGSPLPGDLEDSADALIVQIRQACEAEVLGTSEAVHVGYKHADYVCPLGDDQYHILGTVLQNRPTGVEDLINQLEKALDV